MPIIKIYAFRISYSIINYNFMGLEVEIKYEIINACTLVEYDDGSKYWFVDGELHREDGPAIEHINGDKYWFVDGKLLTEKEFNKWRKQNGRWHISRTHRDESD